MTAGRRVWFGAQLMFFIAVLAAPVIQRGEVPWLVRAIGVLIALGGVALAIAGYAALGRSHSPGTTPVAGGALVSSGVYGFVRNPIYAGWILGSLGFEVIFGSVLGVVVAVGLAVFYDLRVREEEKHLALQYAGFAGYMARVRRFVPGLY